MRVFTALIQVRFDRVTNSGTSLDENSKISFEKLISESSTEALVYLLDSWELDITYTSRRQ